MKNIRNCEIHAIIRNGNLYVVTGNGTEILISKDVEKIIQAEDSDDCYKVSFYKKDGRKADLYYSKESKKYKIFIESKRQILWD